MAAQSYVDMWKELGTKLLIPPEPQIVGALGAAVVAQKAFGSGGPQTIAGTAAALCWMSSSAMRSARRHL